MDYEKGLWSGRADALLLGVMVLEPVPLQPVLLPHADGPALGGHEAAWVWRFYLAVEHLLRSPVL